MEKFFLIFNLFLMSKKVQYGRAVYTGMGCYMKATSLVRHDLPLDAPRPWRCSRPGWMGPWAALSSIKMWRLVALPEVGGVELHDP